MKKISQQLTPIYDAVSRQILPYSMDQAKGIINGNAREVACCADPWDV